MKHMEKRRVLLLGGRTKAKSLAVSLVSQGYKVTVINNSLEECQALAEIKNLTVYHGDATKPYVLDEAGAAECDIAIALTSKDQDNLVACQICKRIFHVKKTVSLVSDPEKTAFFHQMGVDSVVCAISAVTSIIQQEAFIDEMINIIPVGYGKVQIVEVPIPSESPISGKKLWEINLPKEVVVGCILRRDQAIIPRGDTRITGGDTLVIIAGNGQELAAIQVLTGK